jgi:uncharacterized protein YmfQ (DUF2313 family)
MISQYLRNDKLHINKNNPQSNWFKLLQGLGFEFLLFDDKIKYVKSQYDIYNTIDLIEEWEKMVGIPNSCVPIARTLEERRNNVLSKFITQECTTKSQFELIAKTLGFDINVMAGADLTRFPLKFPIMFASSEVSPFLIIVNLSDKYKKTFPFDFPVPFQASAPDILSCFFERLKPAHTKIIYRYVQN